MDATSSSVKALHSFVHSHISGWFVLALCWPISLAMQHLPSSSTATALSRLRVQSTPPTCCPRAIILPRSTKKHTHSISTKPFEAATCSDGLCVQLYNSTTYSKKEMNTMNFVFYTPTVVFSAQKKFISATVRLSPAESNSKGVFRRGLYHNVEFFVDIKSCLLHTHSQHYKFFYNYGYV